MPDIDTRTVRLAAGSVQGPGARPLASAIDLDHDQPIELPDGTVLYADIYRPVTTEPVPVILVYTPYCKRGGWWNTNFNATRFGVPADQLSGLQAIEAPDPGYWCHAGYAVANVDAAGTSHSGGDRLFLGSASGRTAYEVIEWLAARDWCSGRVGMSGNSQLAMIQWAAAALRPPHLAAIAPWEATNDMYRQVLVRGGSPTPTSTTTATTTRSSASPGARTSPGRICAAIRCSTPTGPTSVPTPPPSRCPPTS
nr:CocE/NonD family hydrolase [Pseudonocardia sp. AL041005-10]